MEGGVRQLVVVGLTAITTVIAFASRVAKPPEAVGAGAFARHGRNTNIRSLAIAVSLALHLAFCGVAAGPVIVAG